MVQFLNTWDAEYTRKAVEEQPNPRQRLISIGYGGTVKALIEVLQQLPPEAEAIGVLDEPLIVYHYLDDADYPYVVVKNLP
jgi:hypothetical protein